MRKKTEENTIEKLKKEEELSAKCNTRFITLTDIQLDKQTEQIWNQIRILHPELDKNYECEFEKLKLNKFTFKNDLCVEIRALRTDRDNKSYTNHRIYNYSENQKTKLREFLKKLNDKQIIHCLYYSICSFDSKILSKSKSGNESKSWNNKVALNNAIGTHIIGIDFDDMTINEFKIYKDILTSVGIKTWDLFSGHGVQSLVLLDKYYSFDEIQLKSTLKLLSRGIPVDSKIKDNARLLRLTNTFNSKDVIKYEKGELEDGKLIKTYFLNDAPDVRISFEDFSSALDKLDEKISYSQLLLDSKFKKKNIKTKIKEDEELVEDTAESLTMAKNKISLDRLSDKKLSDLYEMIKIEDLSESVKCMLSGYQVGYANTTMAYLITYFKNLGYSKSRIAKIFKVLNTLKTYDYDWDISDEFLISEINRFFYSNYKEDSFSTELFGYGVVTYSFNKKNTIVLQNYVFEELKNISTKSFALYLSIVLNSNYNSKYSYTISEIAVICGKSRRRTDDSMKELVKRKLISKVKYKYKKGQNRGQKEEYKYKFVSIEKKKNIGFTIFNISELKYLLNLVKNKEITETQLTLAIYLSHICFNDEKKCFISQELLAKELNLTQQAISSSMKKMEEIQLIKRTKTVINDFQFKYDYELFY